MPKYEENVVCWCEMLKGTFKILILLVFFLKTFKNLKSGYSNKANAPEMYVPRACPNLFVVYVSLQQIRGW
jgi:hypothetical protein